MARPNKAFKRTGCTRRLTSYKGSGTKFFNQTICKMKKLSYLFALSIIACSESPEEAAKNKGFSSVLEMNEIVSMGYPTRNLYNMNYNVSSSSDQFLGIKLNFDPELFKIEDGLPTNGRENGWIYEGKNNVDYVAVNYSESNIPNKLIVNIYYDCNQNSIESLRPTIDGVGCGDLSEYSKKVLKDYVASCNENKYPKIDYIKNNALITLNNDKVVSLKIINKDEISYIKEQENICSDVDKKWKNARDIGFQNIREMEHAKLVGLSNSDAWYAAMDSISTEWSSPLDRVTQLYVASDKDWENYIDKGGLRYSRMWRGFEVNGVGVGHIDSPSRSVANAFNVVIRAGYAELGRGRSDVSNDSIKNVLSGYCGSNWEKTALGNKTIFSVDEKWRFCMIKVVDNEEFTITVKLGNNLNKNDLISE